MPVKILVASDKFKGALTQQDAKETLCKSLSETFPEAHIDTYTLSDGGDGFLLAVGAVIPDAERVYARVTDPLGREITAYSCAWPEMA
ncbi:glycerate kinase [Robertkochia sediminum]|uniref:glycerate kinase n=1 Tax=Robertkochia sediminum TaxID=2785326 RepID=UPI001933AA63|nr:glycerate kinase [Robertkochia sediminum]MBL7473708.1 glycerate kinase [Robertkochia sediminum]